MMKRTQPVSLTAFAVEAHYVTIEGREVAFEFRNAEVNYRDVNHRHGQIVDIKFRDTKILPGNQDKTILDWVELYSPEFWMNSGMMRIRGFAQIVVKDGKRNPQPNATYGSPEVPMRLVDVALTPEAALDADGGYRKGRK
jgi:hypothetical protein